MCRSTGLPQAKSGLFPLQYTWRAFQEKATIPLLNGLLPTIMQGPRVDLKYRIVSLLVTKRPRNTDHCTIPPRSYFVK